MPFNPYTAPVDQTIEVDEPCDDYIDTAKVQPAELDFDLQRTIALLEPLDGDYPVPATIDRVLTLLREVRSMAAAMPETADVECGYTGKVDAYYRTGEQCWVWTCPRCGHEQTRDEERD